MKKLKLQTLQYPSRICHECAIKNCDLEINRDRPSMITWHQDVCQWCDQLKSICHPRSYNYPEPPIKV